MAGPSNTPAPTGDAATMPELLMQLLMAVVHLVRYLLLKVLGLCLRPLRQALQPMHQRLAPTVPQPLGPKLLQVLLPFLVLMVLLAKLLEILLPHLQELYTAESAKAQELQELYKAPAPRAVPATAVLPAVSGPAAPLPAPAAPPAPPPPPQAQCLICLEDVAKADMLCAGGGEGAASSSATPAGCGHLYCTGCLREYVLGLVGARTHPLRCPTPGCTQHLSHGNVWTLLADHPADLEIYTKLEVQHVVGQANTFWCPFKDCSAFFERPDVLIPDAPRICPECERDFCMTCETAGWHDGYTCEQFRALPAHQRTTEDAATLLLSAEKKWKLCPKCKHMVERTAGCNHVRCICGASFCYACGKKYLDTKPTATNGHGTPDCKCLLFTVPREQNGSRPEPWKACGKICRCQGYTAVNNEVKQCKNGCDTDTGFCGVKHASKKTDGDGQGILLGRKWPRAWTKMGIMHPTTDQDGDAHMVEAPEAPGLAEVTGDFARVLGVKRKRA